MPYDQTGNEPDSIKSYLVNMIKAQQNDTNANPLKSSSWGAPQQVWNYNPSQDEKEDPGHSNPVGSVQGLQLPDTSTSYEDALKHYSPEHFTKLNALMGKRGSSS
jgi:hypothetical protein